MLFKSQVYTQASGSIGGLTYSHNRGGLYTRARSIPTNPNSTEQQTVRAAFGSLSQRWTQTITQAQRDAWENYAALTPVTNRLGDELILSGQQMYVRCNTVRVQGGIAEVDDGPLIPGNAAFGVTSGTDSIGDYALHYDDTDDWLDQTGAGMMIQTSRNLSQSINYFKGPFRFHSIVLGDDSTPPTTPEGLTVNAFGKVFQAGLRTYVRARCFLADGRISAEQITNVLFS